LDLTKIKHVFVLMLENRSFDHMLGFSGIAGIDGLTGKKYSNTDAVGEPVPPTPDADYAGDYDDDPGHDFEDVQVQLYGTKNPAAGQQPDMSGFVKSYADKYQLNPDKSHRVMYGFAPDKVSVLVTLAKQFAVCDRWFSSLPGPTLPNRLFTHCGTSGGRLDMSPEYFNSFHTIYEIFDKASTANYPKGVPATIYSDGWTAAATFSYLLKYQQQFFGTLDDFYSDCAGAEEDIPAYCFLEPRYSSSAVDGTFFPQNDQHPDSDVRQGEKLIYRVYKAIRKNQKLWESSILVITYDEHGGLYDHVPPPTCTAPDNSAGDLGFDFKRLGVRVPTVIVSPYINPGTVSHTQFDHTTLIATARKLFTGVWQDNVLGARAATANTFDGAEILNRDAPRTDDVNIPTVAPPAADDPAELNALQTFHLQQAIALNESLPVGRKVNDPPPDPSKTKPQAADAYVRKVFAAAKGRQGASS
jgi:phospholipase C